MWPGAAHLPGLLARIWCGTDRTPSARLPLWVIELGLVSLQLVQAS